MDYSFSEIWKLLSPAPKYYNRERVCYDKWQNLSPAERQTVYERIKDKKSKGKFVDYNPFFAIMNNRPDEGPQQLSFNEYYARYNTTLEQGGWKMINPTGNQVIYVKQ